MAKSRLDGGAVEDPQHDRFAVQRRDGRDAEVDLLAAHRSLMRPSCGSRRSAMSSFAMILMREMMAAASRAGGVSTSCSTPSIAVAHAQPVLERLDVDVRGAGLDRAGDQLVDQPDDRRLARQVLQPLGIVFRWLGIGGQLVEHLLAVTALADSA